jgi:CTP synthase (UTP-ammonia lyase)
MLLPVTRSNPSACPVRIGLIGDHDDSVTAHRAIPQALALARDLLGCACAWDWLHTGALAADSERDSGARLAGYHGLWSVPATPYASAAGAIRAIRFARAGGRPFLGTCGGFQHALLEYAEAVWGVAHPAHAETDPAAVDPVIAPLSCALVERSGDIVFKPGSRIASIYGALSTTETYHCRYGPGATSAARLEAGPLRSTGWDRAGEVRAVELEGHPFYVGTLYQPERRALEGRAHPLVTAFVDAARGVAG